MQQEKLTYPVSFGELQKRYNLKQSALSYRIKSLGIKTQRRGRNTFLSVNQLDLLDKLNNFLKENPTQSIEDFVDSQSSHELLINQAITNESLTNHSPIADRPQIHQLIANELPINQSNKALEERVIAIERTLAALCKQKIISENSLATDESLINNNASVIHSENEELREENHRLKQTVEELKQKLEESDRRDTQQKREISQWETVFNQVSNCNQVITQQFNSVDSAHRNMENFYKQAFHLPFNNGVLIGLSDGIYLKTKFKSIEEGYAKINLMQT